jgi:hypothetical protein
LQRLAAAAPILDAAPPLPIDDRLVFRPELMGDLADADAGGGPIGLATPAAGIAATAGVPLGGDAAAIVDPAGAWLSDLRPTVDAHEGWLF